MDSEKSNLLAHYPVKIMETCNIFLSTYYILGTVLGSGNIAVNKTDKCLALRVSIQVRR